MYERLESNPDFSVEDVVNDAEIHAFWYELLRFHAPAGYTYKTKLIKNATVANYKIRKGD